MRSFTQDLYACRSDSYVMEVKLGVCPPYCAGSDDWMCHSCRQGAQVMSIMPWASAALSVREVLKTIEALW